MSYWNMSSNPIPRLDVSRTGINLAMRAMKNILAGKYFSDRSDFNIDFPKFG